MKALGTGIGGFVSTDVEVCRTPGGARTRTRRTFRLHGTRPSSPAPRARAPSICPSPTPTAWPSLSSWGTGSVLGVLTRDPMRAAEAAALPRSARDVGGPRRHGAATAALACSGAPTAWVVALAGRAATAPTAVSRRPSWPGGAPASAWSRRPNRRGDVSLRAIWSSTPRTGPDSLGPTTRPALPAGAATLAIDIPSGVDADSGAAPGAAVRGGSHRDLRRAASPGCCRVAGAVSSGAVEVADIGIGFPTPQALLVEDADVAARCRPGPPGQQVDDTPWGWRPVRPGMEGAAMLCHPWRHGRRCRHDPPRLARQPVRGLATEAVRVHLPAEGGRMRSWTRAPSARRW